MRGGRALAESSRSPTEGWQMLALSFYLLPGSRPWTSSANNPREPAQRKRRKNGARVCGKTGGAPQIVQRPYVTPVVDEHVLHTVRADVAGRNGVRCEFGDGPRRAPRSGRRSAGATVTLLMLGRRSIAGHARRTLSRGVDECVLVSIRPGTTSRRISCSVRFRHARNTHRAGLH